MLSDWDKVDLSNPIQVPLPILTAEDFKRPVE